MKGFNKQLKHIGWVRHDAKMTPRPEVACHSGTLFVSISASQIRILYDGPHEKIKARSSSLGAIQMPAMIH